MQESEETNPNGEVYLPEYTEPPETKESDMAKGGDVTERSVETGASAFTIPGGGRASLLVFAARNAEDIETRRRAQEDAVDVLTQAEEANAVHPVG